MSRMKDLIIQMREHRAEVALQNRHRNDGRSYISDRYRYGIETTSQVNFTNRTTYKEVK